MHPERDLWQGFPAVETGWFSSGGIVLSQTYSPVLEHSN